MAALVASWKPSDTHTLHAMNDHDGGGSGQGAAGGRPGRTGLGRALQEEALQDTLAALAQLQPLTTSTLWGSPCRAGQSEGTGRGRGQAGERAREWRARASSLRAAQRSAAQLVVHHAGRPAGPT